MKVYYITKSCLGLFLSAVALLYFAIAGLASEQTLEGKIIVVDAGHGGIDPGANRPGILEKDINLAIALQIKELLQGQRCKVILTRDTDADLSELCDNEKVRGRYHRDLNARLEMIEESDADLFISIHSNVSSRSQRRGIECYYASKLNDGKRLALAVQQQLSLIAPVSHKAAAANFFVLKRNKVPAALIEVGFITNPDERVQLQSPEYQKKIADAIVKGIVDYYRNPIFHNPLEPAENENQSI